ncbi:sigma factor-like helix-turn-helix DNA-binding protein [Thalassobacillus sp. CUG 92003]|uniref:sigma factor-like helix-turn-helix DNA-binding protein n=1 Tax=Thalassobacillus sp. CUG 92003 TaxID=2736641 RepID=UPI0015E6E70F|nr:sigma factor-like helix-turn-helix DNA-binding protein [Thalassobacillus sp. CUG 92003]
MTDNSEETEDYTQKTKRLLRNYPAFQAKKYAGDFEATDILLDLERAVEKAKLTGRQAEALRYIYEEDMTQVAAGERMGVSQQTVIETYERAVDKIAEVYEQWGHKDAKDELEAE